ncbi:MAG: hypothetical protein ACOCZ5_00815 [bacterium]
MKSVVMFLEENTDMNTVFESLTPIGIHKDVVKLQNTLLKCYKDDFLKMSIEWIGPTPQNIFTKRTKLLSKFVKNKSIILVNNLETARLLHTNMDNYPIFGMLLTNKTLKYNGQEFFNTYNDLFKIFGVLRTKTQITWDGVISSILSLGLSSDIDRSDMTPCVESNLYYIALLMRQLIVNKDNIKSITFVSKKINIKHHINY